MYFNIYVMSPRVTVYNTCTFVSVFNITLSYIIVHNTLVSVHTYKYKDDRFSNVCAGYKQSITLNIDSVGHTISAIIVVFVEFNYVSS